MTNEVQDYVEKKTIRKFSLFKWGGGLALALLAGPLLWMMFYAMLGAALFGTATILTGMVVLTAIFMWDPFIMKLKNKRIALMRAEAAKNPIETLLAGWQQEGLEIQQIRQDHIESVADTGSFADQLRSLASTMTVADVKEYEDDLVLMRASDQKDEQELLVLQSTHSQKKIEIDRLNSKWKMALSLKARNERDMARGRANALQEIMNDAALQSIQREYNVGKATLQVRMAERRNKTLAISNDPSNPITFNTVDTSAKIAIPR